MVFTLTMFAYAKINLALAIVGTYEDGYHELQSIMQSIALQDIVEVSLEGQGITCHCGELSGPDNLAYQAAKVFRERLGCTDGITLRIQKNIPVQAGLAGGSSDAAAVLRGLNRIYDHAFSKAELIDICKSLGADVPFCLFGGTAWATGRGDDFDRLPVSPEFNLVLVKPEKGVNTAQAYRLFNEMPHRRVLNRPDWESALQSGSPAQVAALLSNDLEPASMQLVPEIIKIKQKLLDYNCLGALMSGSGSAVFGIAPTAGEAALIGESLRNEGFQVWQTSTVSAYE